MGVGLSRTEDRIGEGRMVDGVWPGLGLQGEGAAVPDCLTALAGVTSIKEIAAVELQTTLVCPDFYPAPGYGLIERGGPSNALSLIEAPVMVVTAGAQELFVVVTDILSDTLGKSEIVRRPCYGADFTRRNEFVIRRNETVRLNLENMVQNGL